MNLSVILRIFNSNQEVETDKLDILCKQNYELILTTFPWASITPSLHKILAHCTELIRDCNGGYGESIFLQKMHSNSILLLYTCEKRKLIKYDVTMTS